MLDLEEDFTLNVKHAGMYTYEEGCPNKLICFYKVEEITVVLSLIAAIYYTHIHTDFMFGWLIIKKQKRVFICSHF